MAMADEEMCEREKGVLRTEQLNHFLKPLFVTSFGNVFSSIGSQFLHICRPYGTMLDRYKVCGCYSISLSCSPTSTDFLN